MRLQPQPPTAGRWSARAYLDQAYFAKALITSALSMSSVRSKTCGPIAACPQALGPQNSTKCVLQAQATWAAHVGVPCRWHHSARPPSSPAVMPVWLHLSAAAQPAHTRIRIRALCCMHRWKHVAFARYVCCILYAVNCMLTPCTSKRYMGCVHCGRGDPSLPAQPWYGATHACSRTWPNGSASLVAPNHTCTGSTIHEHTAAVTSQCHRMPRLLRLSSTRALLTRAVAASTAVSAQSTA